MAVPPEAVLDAPVRRSQAWPGRLEAVLTSTAACR
jgi:hypothetical protein